MAQFKDNAEPPVEWELRIDAMVIMKIREDCDPEFLKDDTNEDNTYMRLQADPVLLCRVLYLMTKTQREEQRISEEDFYMQVIGGAIDRATVAMLKAIVNFTPERTKLLLEMFAQQDDLRQEALKKAIKKVNSPKLRKKLLQGIETSTEEALQKLMTQLDSASSMPDSLESTQED